MANMHKHPVRGLRGVEDDVWTQFDAAAKAAGGDRSALLRAFMLWYVGRPGAQLPKRPESSS